MTTLLLYHETHNHFWFLLLSVTAKVFWCPHKNTKKMGIKNAMAIILTYMWTKTNAKTTTMEISLFEDSSSFLSLRHPVYCSFLINCHYQERCCGNSTDPFISFNTEGTLGFLNGNRPWRNVKQSYDMLYAHQYSSHPNGDWGRWPKRNYNT